jgi:hemerythrin-like domain-containing protein
MTNTANPNLTEPTDVSDMVVVHRVFRRELGSLPELIRATPGGDVQRASVVAGHARLVLSGLHLHHTGEDDLLWPVLLERAPSSADLVERMEGQHAAVEDLLDLLGPAINRWEAEARPAVAVEAADLIDRLRALVVEHLDAEEELVLPVATWNMTPEEWGAMGEAGVAKMSRAELPLMFGCVLEGASPSEQRALLGNLPFPVRVLMRTWGIRHYRRYINRVRGR